MIDGINLTYHCGPGTHLLALPWEIRINEHTGERVDDNRELTLYGLNLNLKPSKVSGYMLLIRGSIHKYFNRGQDNASQFTFANLHTAIARLCKYLRLTPQDLQIHGIELGVNMETTCDLQKLFKQAVCFKNNAFTPINKKSHRKGLECVLSQYVLKIYDKKKQSGIDTPGNLLRFEVSIKKMQVLKNYHLTTLDDLINIEKVMPLVNVLQDAQGNIIWTDQVNLSTLTQREQKQWLFFSNPRNWKEHSKHTRYKAVRKWDNLLTKYGNPPCLKNDISATWKKLFCIEKEAENGRPFYHVANHNEAEKKATFLPFICTVKQSPNIPANTNPENLAKRISISTNMMEKKKCCLSCGKDISNQRSTSLTCSESRYGKQGKQCRNKQSNARRDKKRKIQAAAVKGAYLIASYSADGITYTDVLHPTEIELTRSSLDRITEIKHFTPCRK